MRKRTLFFRISVFTLSAIVIGAFSFLWFAQTDATVKGLAVVVPKTQIEVKAEVNGKVQSIFVEEGDNVTAEQILVKLDDRLILRQLKQAETALFEAKLNLAELKERQRLSSIQNKMQQIDAQTGIASAEKALKELRDKPALSTLTAQQQLFSANIMLEQAKSDLLDAQNGGDKRRIDEAQAQYDMAKSMYEMNKEQFNELTKGATEEELANAEAAVSRSRLFQKFIQSSIESGGKSQAERILLAADKMKQTQEAYEEAKAALEATAIKSTIDGQILSVDVKEGDYVQLGAQMAIVADTSQFIVKAQIPEGAIFLISTSQTVRIHLNALQDKHEYVEGRIEKISPAMVSSRTGTFADVTISICSDADSKLKLRPFLTGYVKVSGERRNVLSFLLSK